MTIRIGQRPPPPPPPDWLVADAERFRAAVEAARAEAALAQRWFMPDTAAVDLVLAQDIALVCPLYMSKLTRVRRPSPKGHN